MNCLRVADQLLRFRDGELSEPETEDLRRHLHLCPPCLHLLDGYEEVVEVLKRLRPCCIPSEVMERLKARFCKE